MTSLYSGGLFAYGPRLLPCGPFCVPWRWSRASPYSSGKLRQVVTTMSVAVVGGERTRRVTMRQSCIKVSLTISCRNVASLEHGYDAEDEDTSAGEEDISFQASISLSRVIC